MSGPTSSFNENRALEPLSIENMICEFLRSTCESILKHRNGNLMPVGCDNYSMADNLNYCQQCLMSWRKDILKPLALDLFIYDTATRSLVLMERWKISYQRSKEFGKEHRHPAVIARRISTLIRTLHCFIRMLPGYCLIKTSKKIFNLSFQIYDNRKQESQPSFMQPVLNYKFPSVSVSKGSISMSVNYLPMNTLKVIFPS